MLNFNKIERKKKIDHNINSRYQSIINNIEKNIMINSTNIELPTNFLEIYNNYKITSRLILDDPTFFYNYNDIINDNKNNEIWLNEHHEKIINYISFTDIFFKLIKHGFFYGYISPVQYKLAKIIFRKINNIWYSEFYLKNIYNSNKKIPCIQELLFFYDIIEIIYYKLKIHNMNNKNENEEDEKNLSNSYFNIKNLINNNYYLETINNEKIYYQQFIS
jgi:hypothetical protein